MDSDEGDMMTEDTDLAMMSRDWNKITRARYNDGFRDGSTAGQNQSLQEAFNAGFKQGFLSSYIVSKIRGILTALLAYQMSYEGHPITDSTTMESHSLLEDIDSLEANSVAEEFLRLSLHQTSSTNCPNDIIKSLSATTVTKNTNSVPGAGNTGSQSSSMSDEEGDASNLDLDAVNNLTVKEVNQILMQCPPIVDIINRCKAILKSLNWSDEMIDSLL